MDDKDYFTVDSLTADDFSQYQQEIGSFAYMPKKFLDIDTQELGFSRSGQSPFLQLKDKIINDPSITADDRMQGIRYLCSIPYNNGTKHCVEAVDSIIRDPSIDIYKRFHFINTREKYLRLDDHVAHLAYPLFFKYGLEEGGLVVPVELLLLCAQYIFNSYGADTGIRQGVLDWCLNILENKHEDIYTQLQIAKFFMEHGQPDEIDFAKDFVESLGLKSPDDMVPTAVEQMARGILRQLQTQYSYVDNVNSFLDDLAKHFKAKPEQLDLLCNVFNELCLDSVECDMIASVVYQAICKLGEDSPHVKAECMNRIVREVLVYTEPTHDMIYSLIAVLDGFVEPRPLQFVPSPVEKLRNDVFAALSHKLLSEVEEGLRNEVYASIDSTDKSVAKEFLSLYDFVEDEIYESNKGNFGKDEFKEAYDQVIKEWLNLSV
jgi:hypothetical protein